MSMQAIGLILVAFQALGLLTSIAFQYRDRLVEVMEIAAFVICTFIAAGILSAAILTWIVWAL